MFIDKTFFAELGRLAGSQHRENQVSRTFAACFNESVGFQRVVLPKFLAALGRSTALPKGRSWRCSPEVQAPVAGGGRVDLYLAETRADGSAGASFYVESKVESPLTKKQVAKYRSHGVRPLVVITKYQEDHAPGVPTLRWQDLHRALRLSDEAGVTARQLCGWMADYLEDLDMAYREDLTLTDLRACGRLFSAVRSDKTWSQFASLKVFETAHACAAMLEDLHQEFLDSHPKLMKTPYRNSRTHYAKWIDSEDGSAYHHLRWSIARGSWSKWRLACSICWSEDPAETPSCYLELSGTSVKEDDFDQSLKKFVSKGVVDRAKLLNHLTAHARRWKIV